MVTLSKTDMTKRAFAERLHERLDELGYSPRSGVGRGRYTEVGNDFKLTYQSTKKWLDGISMPQQARSIQVADFYGLRYEWLMTGVGEKYLPGHSGQDKRKMGGSLGDMLKDPSKPAATPDLIKDVAIAYSSNEKWELSPDEVEILRAWRTLPEDSKSIIQAMFRAQAAGAAH